MSNGTAILYLWASFFSIVVSLIVLYIRQIGKSIDGLRSDMNAGYDRLHAGQNNLRAELKADMKAGHAELKADIGALSQRVEKLEVRVGKLEVDVAALRAHISGWTTFLTVITRTVSVGEPTPQHETAHHSPESLPNSGPPPPHRHT